MGFWEIAVGFKGQEKKESGGRMLGSSWFCECGLYEDAEAPGLVNVASVRMRKLLVW
jgi:hypothetical protein